jgi:hypothetical protein
MYVHNVAEMASYEVNGKLASLRAGSLGSPKRKRGRAVAVECAAGFCRDSLNSVAQLLGVRTSCRQR